MLGLTPICQSPPVRAATLTGPPRPAALHSTAAQTTQQAVAFRQSVVGIEKNYLCILLIDWIGL